jgi:hypothetical protein
LGLDRSVLHFSIAPDLNGYDPVRSLGLYRQLKERLGALPGWYRTRDENR